MLISHSDQHLREEHWVKAGFAHWTRNAEERQHPQVSSVWAEGPQAQDKNNEEHVGSDREERCVAFTDLWGSF